MKGSVKKLSSLILGLLFLLSGTLKLMDPVGTGLIVENYISFFHLGFLRPFSVAMGFGLALLETILGAAVLCGVWKKFVWAAFGIVMGGFTVLTLILLIFNPDMDCGCFSEAVHLSHFASFAKNLVILGLWGLTFRRPGLDGVIRLPHKYRYWIFWTETALIVAFGVMSFFRLPLMDFTAMAPGVELFSYDNPEGPVLSIVGEDGYVDEFPGKTLVVSGVYPLGEKQLERLGALRVPKDVEVLWTGLEGPYVADRKTILTLNRSNGGATYIVDGQVVAKWHNRDLPCAEEFDMEVQDLLSSRVNVGQKRYEAFLMLLLVLTLI